MLQNGEETHPADMMISYPVFTLELEELLNHLDEELPESLFPLYDLLLRIIEEARTGRPQFIQVRNESR